MPVFEQNAIRLPPISWNASYMYNLTIYCFWTSHYYTGKMRSSIFLNLTQTDGWFEYILSIAYALLKQLLNWPRFLVVVVPTFYLVIQVTWQKCGLLCLCGKVTWYIIKNQQRSPLTEITHFPLCRTIKSYRLYCNILITCLRVLETM